MIRKRKSDGLPCVQSKRRLLSDASNHMLPLVRNLLHKWAWGVLSAASVQEMAYDAELSGLENDELSQLAGIGAHGTNNKQHRDLMRLCCNDLKIAEPYQYMIPAIDPKGSSNRAIATETFFLLSQWLIFWQRKTCSLNSKLYSEHP